MHQIAVPKSIFGGFYWRSHKLTLTLGLLAHSLQCDQRWIFLVRVQPGRVPYRFCYRTMGDAKPNFATAKDAGWHWPWQDRSVSGRG